MSPYVARAMPSGMTQLQPVFPETVSAHRPKSDNKQQAVVLSTIFIYYFNPTQGFSGDSMLKNPPANAGDTGSVPG